MMIPAHRARLALSARNARSVQVVIQFATAVSRVTRIPMDQIATCVLTVSHASTATLAINAPTVTIATCVCSPLRPKCPRSRNLALKKTRVPNRAQMRARRNARLAISAPSAMLAACVKRTVRSVNLVTRIQIMRAVTSALNVCFAPSAEDVQSARRVMAVRFALLMEQIWRHSQTRTWLKKR